jgi:hypothetical protein
MIVCSITTGSALRSSANEKPGSGVRIVVSECSSTASCASICASATAGTCPGLALHMGCRFRTT